MILNLHIISQKIYCDEVPFLATESKNYLECKFEFSTDWEGCIKTAIFRGVTGVPYCVKIEDDTCTVPYEVLTGNVFLISVFGILDDKRITTNTVDIYVKDSGYAEGETPPEPTPTVYEKMLKELHTINTIQQEELDNKADKTDIEVLRTDIYGLQTQISNQEVFVVHTEFSSIGKGLSCSETYDDILNAYNSGKIIRFLMENGFVVYPFVQYDRSENNLYFQYCIDNTWCVYMLGREDIETTTTMWQIASISAMNADLYEPFIGEMSELLFADSLVNAVNINHNNITENQTHITELYNQLDSRVHYEEFGELQTQMGEVETALDGIITIQNTLIGGDAV